MSLLAVTHAEKGDSEVASEWAARSLEIMSLDDRTRGQLFVNAMHAAIAAENVEVSTALLHEMPAVSGGESRVSQNLAAADLALLRGDYQAALEGHRAGLTYWPDSTDPSRLWETFTYLAACFSHLGEHERAGRFFGQAELIRKRYGLPQFRFIGRVAREAADLSRKEDEAALNRGWAAGLRMSVEEALAEASVEIPSKPTAEPVAVEAKAPLKTRRGRWDLTAREMDVLALLVEGQSDRQIAETLVLSPRTAMSHVASILGKLGVGSRTAAAIYAVRNDLVSAN
jgi:DNA-binding CsgD family transcriptional regulator